MGMCHGHDVLEDEKNTQELAKIKLCNSKFDTPMKYEDSYQLFPKFKNIEKYARIL